MLHARNLVKDETFRRNHLDFHEYVESCGPLHPAQQNALENTPRRIEPPHRASTQGPLVVQLAGNEPNLVVEAANCIMEYTNGQVHGIDLNCGCPQGIARKGQYGAFLMEDDSNRVCDILRALRSSLPSTTAVSVKIRLPLDPNELEDRVLRLMDTGVDFLTIHGRTLRENKTLVGACHTDEIKRAIEIARGVRPSFPVVANGGIEHLVDVSRVIAETSASATMSSEALLERPNLFSTDSSGFSPQQVYRQQLQFAEDYLSWCEYSPPLPGVLGHVGGSFNIVRGHLFKFLHRYVQEHGDLRDRLASQRLTSVDGARELLSELRERYDCLQENAQWLGLSSSDSEASWYRRHWSSASVRHSRAGFGETNSVSSIMSVEDRKALIRARLADYQNQRVQKTA